jgi:hypothetical protein
MSCSVCSGCGKESPTKCSRRLALVREDNGVAAQVLRRLAPDRDFRHLVMTRIRNAS